MSHPDKHIPIVIVGGGPVGLFLAIALLKKGISCRVLEQRENPVPDSRSLGIHPISVELFDELGITEPFLKAGLKIKKGLALTGKRKLGEILFEQCPEPHNYILACPQFTTEKILREELNKLDEDALITQAEFQHFSEQEDEIEISYSTPSQAHERITATYLVGCDGKSSRVRKKASIHYSGKRYKDTYIMGDFEDNTEFGSDAAIFLPKAGVIECFPLPKKMRRWVVKTSSFIDHPTKKELATNIQSRIGYELFEVAHTMVSSFGVQHFAAETFAKGRVLLAGDAAHVVSPIGGQGMNLGWLGAAELARTLADIMQTTDDLNNAQKALKAYSDKQKKITKKVARRAELNMTLGRKTSIPFLRNLLLKTMLHSPLRQKAAEAYTMRGLEHWWI